MDIAAPEWLAHFAEQLGTKPPNAKESDTLLGLAGMAAHASERTAAPLACWLVGRSGMDPEAALRVAKELNQTMGTSPD